jgi:hypothetical protein
MPFGIKEAKGAKELIRTKFLLVKAMVISGGF